jgi:hypothetical protein
VAGLMMEKYLTGEVKKTWIEDYVKGRTFYLLRQQRSILNKIDWLTVVIYFALVILGWLNIYAAVYDEEVSQGFWNIFDPSLNSGKQFLWILSSILIIIVILTVDFRFYDSFAFVIYGLDSVLTGFCIIFWNVK